MNNATAIAKLILEAKTLLDNGGTREEAIALVANYAAWYSDEMYEALMYTVDNYRK